MVAVSPAGSAAQVDYLSTFGSNPLVASVLGSTNFTISPANSGIAVLFRPHRTMTLRVLEWYVGVTGGNYDVAVLSSTGSRLWSKGTTATPAVGAVSETVPDLQLQAGTDYYGMIAFDGTTATCAGASARHADVVKLLSAASLTRLVGSVMPIPASVTLGSTGSLKVPLMQFREA